MLYYHPPAPDNTHMKAAIAKKSKSDGRKVYNLRNMILPLVELESSDSYNRSTEQMVFDPETAVLDMCDHQLCYCCMISNYTSTYLGLLINCMLTV